jgi:hypothetical protein
VAEGVAVLHSARALLHPGAPSLVRWGRGSAHVAAADSLTCRWRDGQTPTAAMLAPPVWRIAPLAAASLSASSSSSSLSPSSSSPPPLAMLSEVAGLAKGPVPAPAAAARRPAVVEAETKSKLLRTSAPPRPTVAPARPRVPLLPRPQPAGA